MRTFIILALAVTLGVEANAQTEECTAGTSAFASELFESATSYCCSRSTPKRCLKNARNALKDVREVIGEDIFTTVRAAINQARNNSCDLDSISLPTCTADSSTTVTEAVSTIESLGCNKRFNDRRQSVLKSIRRDLRDARTYYSTEYINSVRSGTTDLLKSASCGEGGEDRLGQCSRIVDPRDGTNGNVYKQTDHGCTGVFVTHDGSRSGQVVTTSGSTIENLNYTGLANADQNGLRHHYRTRTCCSSLPGTFYLRLGSTCYEINRRCGRID